MCISIEPFYLNNSTIGWLMAGKKEKLSELEQQLKRAEAAQRRKMQSEKAAREAEVCSIMSYCHSLFVCWQVNYLTFSVL